MKSLSIAIGIVFCLCLVVVNPNLVSSSSEKTGGKNTPIQNNQNPSFRYGGGNFTPSEQAGAEIWFKATGGNERFFSYVYPQRLGVTIDWYRVLSPDYRDHRFNKWGLINDPDCCKPGDPNCPLKSLDDTYGLDYCPGDEELLKHVGKPEAKYRDPACDFKDAALDTKDPHGAKDQRQSACDLRFGTSSGAMGIRKFPNPRFNKEVWIKVNGSLGTWAGYNKRVQPSDSALPDVSRLIDGSIEPPFLIGLSCGACHISFDPLHPPKDPAHPSWENISGTVGSQYSRFSQILGSGMSSKSIEYQVYQAPRPGTVDTSAIPNDQINNPGTMNPIINVPTRPLFSSDVMKWRKVNQCPIDSNERTCWCEPGKDGKCWERSKKTEQVHHILKGGEDDIGTLEAIQRVYMNIGSCSEESWANHLTDMRELDPTRRAFGQTPFDIGQTRRDCPHFRAVEDRLGNIADFLSSARPTDLYQAKGLKSMRDLVEKLDKEFGKGSVDQGKLVFAKNCAKCHSSQTPPFESRDFREISKNPDHKGMRIDWLGNDQVTLVSEIGTDPARALHSNHMKGHVWEEYGSETLRAKPKDMNIKEPSDGGRGYYRNVSLLSVWAYAPFMHNNALGPELCGGAEDRFYTSPYVDENNAPLPNAPACWPFDPSVEGRYKLYKASMTDLLNPGERIPKVTMFNDDVVIKSPGVSIVFPKGTPASRIGNFRHKEFANDLILSKTDFPKLKAKYGEKNANAIKMAGEDIVRNPGKLLEVGGTLREIYSNSLTIRENDGHRFGESLSDKEKNALIAFLATL